MSRGGDTRFVKGQSGNPAGRPRKRRPNISAFDIVFDKILSITEGDAERELTIDEALQLQTYQAALKGSRMATRQVLKMIEKREAAIARLSPPAPAPTSMYIEYDSDNANEAMRILGIVDYREEAPGAGGPASRPMAFARWAIQAAISRPGRGRLNDKEIEDVKRTTRDADKLRWPRRRSR